MFNEIFEARIKELWNLYKASGEINHSGEKGFFREIFVKKVFLSLLPIQYGIGSGIIVDKWKRQSPQCDLIIYDKRTIPPIMDENGYGIYPMDSVLRIVEVKSILNRDGIEQYKNICNSIDPKNPVGLKVVLKGNLDNGQTYYPFAAIFSYTSDIVDFHNKRKEYGLENWQYPICILKEKNEVESIESMVTKTKSFAISLIDCIEESSNSRSCFKVKDWII